MKKIMILVGAASFFLIMACGAALEYQFTTNVSGYVYDARSESEATISGATVTVKTLGGTTVATTSTSGSGYYSLNELAQGEYEISAQKNGYAFAPVTLAVAGEDSVFPNIMGFETDGSYKVSIIVTWDGDVVDDIDAYVTVPPTSVGLDPGTYSPYGPYGWPNATPDETITNGRVSVNHANKTPAAGAGRGVTLDRDSTASSISKVETITLPAALTGVDGEGGFGVLGYYLNSFSGEKLATQGSPLTAKTTVYVFVGSDLIGRYELPSYTNIDAARVLRIHAYDNGYEIYPEVQTLTGTTDFRNLVGPQMISTRRSR